MVNIIAGKLSGKVILGLIAVLVVVALTVGSNPVTAGAEEDISKYNEPWNGTIKYKNGGVVLEQNQMQRMTEAGVRNDFTREEIGEFFVSKVKTLARAMGISYGANREILEINGKPWQETEYRDLILNNLDYYGDSQFRFYPGLFAFVNDPKYNDRADEVMEWVKTGKTRAEVEGTIKETDKEVEDSSKYNEPWNGIMIYKSGDKIIELNQMRRVVGSGDRDKFTEEEIGEFFVSNVKTASQIMGMQYGLNIEILEINNKPWQDTEYRDLILDNLDYYGDSKFKVYPVLFEFVNDPKYNGRADEVMEWVKNGKTKEVEVEGTIKETE